MSFMYNLFTRFDYRSIFSGSALMCSIINILEDFDTVLQFMILKFSACKG